MKRGIKNLLLSLVGFSAAPMLTACYGTAYDDYYPYPTEGEDICGYVVDEQLNPIKGIMVYSTNNSKDFTDEAGRFELVNGFGGMGNEMVTATDVDMQNNGGEFSTEVVVANRDNINNLCIVLNKEE